MQEEENKDEKVDPSFISKEIIVKAKIFTSLRMEFGVSKLS